MFHKFLKQEKNSWCKVWDARWMTKNKIELACIELFNLSSMLAAIFRTVVRKFHAENRHYMVTFVPRFKENSLDFSCRYEICGHGVHKFLIILSKL